MRMESKALQAYQVVGDDLELGNPGACLLRISRTALVAHEHRYALVRILITLRYSLGLYWARLLLRWIIIHILTIDNSSRIE